MKFSDPKENIKQFVLDRGMVVADFGAGSGGYTIPAAKAVGSRGLVYAIDVQQELLSRIKNNANKEKLENVDTIWGDVEILGGSGLKGESVDAVIVSNILFLVDDKNSLVQEVSRVLNRTGKVLVVDWKDSFGGLGPRQDDIVTVLDIKSIFEKYDFMLHHEINAGSHHYGLVFKRKN